MRGQFKVRSNPGKENVVVAVAAETDAQAKSAIEVMKRHGATDIDQRATE